MRGYTLVEVIVVLVILSLILLISFPSIMRTLQQAEERHYEEFVNTIIAASEVYIEMEEDVYNLEDPGDTVTITVADLVDAGLYSGNIRNPKTEEMVDLNDEIVITLEENYVKDFEYISDE